MRRLLSKQLLVFAMLVAMPALAGCPNIWFCEACPPPPPPASPIWYADGSKFILPSPSGSDITLYSSSGSKLAHFSLPSGLATSMPYFLSANDSLLIGGAFSGDIEEIDYRTGTATSIAGSNEAPIAQSPDRLHLIISNGSIQDRTASTAFSLLAMNGNAVSIEKQWSTPTAMVQSVFWINNSIFGYLNHVVGPSTLFIFDTSLTQKDSFVGPDSLYNIYQYYYYVFGSSSPSQIVHTQGGFCYAADSGIWRIDSASRKTVLLTSAPQGSILDCSSDGAFLLVDYQGVYLLNTLNGYYKLVKANNANSQDEWALSPKNDRVAHVSGDGSTVEVIMITPP